MKKGERKGNRYTYVEDDTQASVNEIRKYQLEKKKKIRK